MLAVALVVIKFCILKSSVTVVVGRLRGHSLWSQAQRDTSDPDNFQNPGYWLTIRHRCICMWSWTEMLFFSFHLRAKTDCMNSASYEYRNMSARRGAQFVPIGISSLKKLSVTTVAICVCFFMFWKCKFGSKSYADIVITSKNRI